MFGRFTVWQNACISVARAKNCRWCRRSLQLRWCWRTCRLHLHACAEQQRLRSSYQAVAAAERLGNQAETIGRKQAKQKKRVWGHSRSTTFGAKRSLELA